MILSALSLLLILNYSCQPQQESKEKEGVEKIVIFDKSARLPDFDSIVVQDSLEIVAIIHEIQKIRPYADSLPLMQQRTILKNSFGGFDIVVHYKHGTSSKYNIVYTVYDGIVIDKDLKLYKNDHLEMKLLKYILQKLPKN